MANYDAWARSNYFHVTDVATFKEWATKHFLEVHEDEGDPTLVMIHPQGGEGDWPGYYYEEQGEDIDFDICESLPQFIEGDDVAILMEAGHEKLRYVCGYAVAVNRKGETTEISLNDIYEKAKRLGTIQTECSY